MPDLHCAERMIAFPNRRRATLWMAAILSPGAGPALAQSGALELQGRVRSGKVVLAIDDLRRLPQQSFSTNTPWTRQARTYTGPLLRDVLALAGADAAATRLRAVALNDYQIDIPVEDARSLPVIVAHLVDHQPIPVRERGPLFVIYPFDSSKELQTMRYYERAIWQLRRILVE